MTFQPDLADPETDGSIFDRIASTIASLSPISNFSINSPERALVSGVSREFRERQHELLSVQLGSRLEFAGKDIDRDDLEALGLDPSVVDLELLNSFQEDSDLAAIAARNGLTRDPGSFAEGDVVFQLTDDAAVIPSGTTVTTAPVGDAEVIVFETTTDAAASPGDTQLTVPVEAVTRGEDGNVGANQLTRLPSPPPLVGGDPAVTNPAPTSGGEDVETNAELRDRIRQSLVASGRGGTVAGVEAGIIETFDGLDSEDVLIDESASVQPGFDVIVDGGPTDTELTSEINRLQPVAIDGRLVRPSDVVIDVTASVTGSNIDTATVEDAIRDLLAELGLAGDVIRDQIIAAIITSQDGIVGVDSLTVTANGTTVSNDRQIGLRESPEPGSISVSVV
jgi:uncharacterized phage protein gp47/JayE